MTTILTAYGRILTTRPQSQRGIPVRYTYIFPIVAILFVSGCVSSKSGGVYKRDQARALQSVELGIVEHVREVHIEGTKSGIGAAIGSAVGGVIGNEVGDGSTKKVATILGAAGGGAAGAAAEEAATRQKGLEITVELDSGQLIAVVQAADEPFNIGDRVRVLSGQGVTRVTH